MNSEDTDAKRLQPAQPRSRPRREKCRYTRGEVPRGRGFSPIDWRRRL